ncbi:MAG: hypothetical protein HFF15_06875 [Angelakisella sp.]|nr:hypothetical protein [Angelakisella sp.]
MDFSAILVVPTAPPVAMLFSSMVIMFSSSITQIRSSGESAPSGLISYSNWIFCPSLMTKPNEGMLISMAESPVAASAPTFSVTNIATARKRAKTFFIYVSSLFLSLAAGQAGALMPG